MQSYREQQGGVRPAAFVSRTGVGPGSAAPAVRRGVGHDSRSRLRTADGAAASARRDARSANTVAPRRSAGAASRSRVGARASRATDFMRYANDNVVVRTIYSFVTGPTKYAFYGILAVAVVLSVYFPVRDLYIAQRMSDIYSQQLAQHEEYNAQLEADVDKLMTREGIADEAHERFGYVMPGETSGKVVGLNEDGTPVQEGSEGGSASQQGAGSQAGSGEDGEASAEGSEGVPENVATSKDLDKTVSPWYSGVLDALFFFSADDVQTVSSAGAES